MEYRIGEFADIVGLTAYTLKHYEREQIVTPHTHPENGYRYYQDSDVIHYTMIRMLRGLEMSVPQIADMRKHSTPGQMEEYLAHKELELSEMIARSTNLLNKVRYIRNSFKRLDGERSDCAIREIPEIYRLKKAVNDEILISPQINSATRELMDALPYSYFTIRISRENFFCDGALEFNWGLGITKEDFTLLGLSLSDVYEYSPRMKIASTIVVKDELLPIRREDLLRLRQFVLDNRLATTGEVMIRLLTCAYPQGKPQYYYSVAIPLEESSNP